MPRSIAVYDQERAGIDIVTDGEMRRESYFNRFATALEGIDLDNPGTVISRTGKKALVPRVVGKVRRTRPVGVRDVQFLRAHTDRQIKITVPGRSRCASWRRTTTTSRRPTWPATTPTPCAVRSRICSPRVPTSSRSTSRTCRRIRSRRASMAWPRCKRALDGVRGTTALHICFGYGSMVKGKPARYDFLPELNATPVQQMSVETAQPSLDCSVLAELPGKTIILGTLDLSTSEIETPETVAARIRRALPYVNAERIDRRSGLRTEVSES